MGIGELPRRGVSRAADARPGPVARDAQVAVTEVPVDVSPVSRRWRGRQSPLKVRAQLRRRPFSVPTSLSASRWQRSSRRDGSSRVDGRTKAMRRLSARSKADGAARCTPSAELVLDAAGTARTRITDLPPSNACASCWRDRVPRSQRRDPDRVLNGAAVAGQATGRSQDRAGSIQEHCEDHRGGHRHRRAAGRRRLGSGEHPSAADVHAPATRLWVDSTATSTSRKSARDSGPCAKGRRPERNAAVRRLTGRQW